MHTFPRPRELTLDAPREPEAGACPACGAEEIERYDVLSEGGWWHVRKCRACLASLDRERAPRLGPITPLVSRD